MSDLIIREIHTMPEFNEILELQQTVWGMSPGEAVSPYIFNAVSHNGGVVLGADLDGRIVGFCFGFVSWRDESRLLWSHITGVLPGFHGQGIGFKLKHAQRIWALEHDFDEIGWTFDPMQRGNANFNFRRLRVIANLYHANLYGEMSDEINVGLASDRLDVRWQLNDQRVIASAEERALENTVTHFTEEAFIVRNDDSDGLIRAEETVFDKDTCYIEIPYRINNLKRDDMSKAQAWQLAVRWAMQQAFEQGYVIVDFITQEERGWYALKRK